MRKSFFTRKVVSALMGVYLMGMAAVCQAYVDDARIMNSFNEDNEMVMYDYLNQNNFRFYNKYSFDDGYIKNDNSLFMIIRRENTVLAPDYQSAGKMLRIFFLKDGYRTNKGIHVGSTLSDVTNAYGQAYPYTKSDIYTNDPETGFYIKKTIRIPTGKYTSKDLPFYVLSYYDRDQHWLQFLVNASDKKVKAIAYKYGQSQYGVEHEDDIIAHLNRWGLLRYILPMKTNHL